MNLFKLNYLLPFWIVMAFLFSDFAKELKFLIVPMLIFMMTLSIKNIAFHHIDKHEATEILKLIVLNYVVLAGITIALSFIFISDEVYRNAFIILGIMPPAAGIISLSYILHADVEVGFVTEFIAYLISIFLVPFLCLLFFGEYVQPIKIFEVIGLVILVPLILSRVLHFAERFRKISKFVSKSLVNLSYSFCFFIIIGMNVDVFFNNFHKLYGVIFVTLVIKFGFGTLFYYLFKKDILCVLFGVFKNAGAATAIVILLFGYEATVPYAIHGIITPFFIFYLEYLVNGKLS